MDRNQSEHSLRDDDVLMASTTSPSTTTAVPNNLFEPMVTIKPTTFDDLKRTPSKALIEYCRAIGIPPPIEGNRFAYISTPPEKLEFFPVSETLHTQIFPHHLNVLYDPIGFVISRQEGTKSFWHVIFVKDNTDKLYRTVCDIDWLTSLDEDDLSCIEDISPALLSFAADPSSFTSNNTGH